MKRSLTGARESAAAAADVAEARAVRIRELEAELLKVGQDATSPGASPTRRGSPRRHRPLLLLLRARPPRAPPGLAAARAGVSRSDGRRPRNRTPACSVRSSGSGRLSRLLDVPILVAWTCPATQTLRFQPLVAAGLHHVNIPTRPSPNTMRIFSKSVAMRSCE